MLKAIRCLGFTIEEGDIQFRQAQSPPDLLVYSRSPDAKFIVYLL